MRDSQVVLPHRCMHDHFPSRLRCCLAFALYNLLATVLADDTLSVFEPPVRNSGVVGGLFLARGEANRTDAFTRFFPAQKYTVGGPACAFFRHARQQSCGQVGLQTARRHISFNTNRSRMDSCGLPWKLHIWVARGIHRRIEHRLVFLVAGSAPRSHAVSRLQRDQVLRWNNEGVH